MKTLNETVEYIRNIGDQLISYNWPQSSQKIEEKISVLKTNLVCIDGYIVNLYYSKSDYGDHLLETIQIHGRDIPFLPFHVVFKIAKKFLGTSNLYLTEIPRAGAKIYCWFVMVDKNGKPLVSPAHEEGETCYYGKSQYQYLDPSKVHRY